ncbi:hypothetical protein HDU91_005290 [Kappamyces sp. JEL0680]|nr:hypothetical protein HDU91_005290 [Kappamyces sp. JEL0680]
MKNEKEEISIQKNDFARGYQRLGQNITQYQSDWHEGVDLYAAVDDGHVIKQRGIKTLSGSNPIPKAPARWEACVNAYVCKMEHRGRIDSKHVGRLIMRGMALGLGQSEDFFESYYTNPFWVMRLIGYPPLGAAAGSGISCGEHTDYGMLTILNTDDTPGALQVKTKGGDWIDADPIEGCFVINIGDMVNNLTNDLYKSTLHRVIHKGSNYRISVPFFFEPNFESVIAPLPDCVALSAGRKPLYDPVMYGDHLLSKVLNNFDVGEQKNS